MFGNDLFNLTLIFFYVCTHIPLSFTKLLKCKRNKLVLPHINAWHNVMMVNLRLELLHGAIYQNSHISLNFKPLGCFNRHRLKPSWFYPESIYEFGFHSARRMSKVEAQTCSMYYLHYQTMIWRFVSLEKWSTITKNCLV